VGRAGPVMAERSLIGKRNRAVLVESVPHLVK
jgi:hypothetical protein